jgi:PKD repeat protein/subtilisin family serine protease
LNFIPKTLMSIISKFSCCMKKLMMMATILLFGWHAGAQISSVDPLLLEKLTHPAEQENYFRVRILLTDRIQVDSLAKALDQAGIHFEHRVRTTVRLLTEKAAATQPAWIQRIEMLERELPGSLKYITPYWITNLLVIEARPALILALVNQNAGIEALEEDMDPYHVTDPVVVESPNSPQIPNGTEAGLRIVKAPALWARDYTGRGRLAMNSDNGVTLQHPTLANRWRGNFVPASQAWFGPGTNPTACSGGNNHGTHVMGTMVGLDLVTSDTIGLAFNSQWIAAGSLCGGSGGTTGAFQWALNPDGDTSTTHDVPDVINNSWGGSQGTAQCNSTVVPVLDALEAAGVAVVFSAGNSGPGASTITSPKNVNTNEVNTFCVGNVQGAVSGFPINNSSSRGPSICITTNPELLIKPEVSAPGTAIRSASSPTGYASLTGTSMAAPHVAGGVLLLKEAFPYLPGSTILRAIYYSATDLGDPGEDNTYGMGLMDLDAAFNWLVSQNHTPARPAYGEYNVRASQLIAPVGVICEDSIRPIISFINLGDSNIQQATIEYGFNNMVANQVNWTGLLTTDQIDTVQLPAIPFPTGLNNASFFFRLLLDTSLAEPDTFDNRLSSIVNLRGQGQPPLFERFENAQISNTQLISINPDNLVGWSTTTTAGRPTGNRSANIPLFNYGAQGARDYLETGRLFAPDTGLFVLRYAVAYAQRDSSSSDSLNIYVSTNCGETWQPISQKGGSNLATVNPQSTSFLPVNPTHWRREVLDLSAFNGSGEVVIRFESVNNNGNNLFIDDIQLLISNMPPVMAFNFQVQAGCNPVDILFTADAFNADSLRWEFAPGLSSNLYNPMVSLNSGIYPVKLVGYNNFGSDSLTLNVVVPQAPVANYSLLNDTVNAGRLIGLINLSQFASSYFWDFGDGTTAIGFSPAKSYQQQGTYTISLFAGNANCTDSLIQQDVITVIQGVSVQELMKQRIRVYPNPTQQAVTIEWGDAEVRQLDVRNTMGQLVDRYTMNTNHVGQLEIEVGHLPKGMYLLQLSGRDFVVTKPLIRQ